MLTLSNVVGKLVRDASKRDMLLKVRAKKLCIRWGILYNITKICPLIYFDIRSFFGKNMN